jgi:hypothetical protein
VQDLVAKYNFDGRLVFTRKDINEFLKRKRPAHRPRQTTPTVKRKPKPPSPKTRA